MFLSFYGKWLLSPESQQTIPSGVAQIKLTRKIPFNRFLFINLVSRLQLFQFSSTEDKIQTFTATLAENIHNSLIFAQVGFKKKPDNLKSHYSSVPKIHVGANTTTDL